MTTTNQEAGISTALSLNARNGDSIRVEPMFYNLTGPLFLEMKSKDGVPLVTLEAKQVAELVAFLTQYLTRQVA